MTSASAPTATSPNAGDVGPEASVFIAAEDSPTGEALLVLGNEISGTTAILGVTPIFGGN